MVMCMSKLFGVYMLGFVHVYTFSKLWYICVSFGAYVHIV